MLSAVEARIVGCLLEKERTVPDQYPLSLNALVSACNQATSREPVMHLDDAEVSLAITSLKAEGWLRMVHPSHGRSVTRYRHSAGEKLDISVEQAALVAVLLLRGAQTVSELRSRAERQHAFASVSEVEVTLQQLADRSLVERLARQPGQKEPRWRQLIADEIAIEPVVTTDRGTAAASSGGVAERIAELEMRVARLEAVLGDLMGEPVSGDVPSSGGGANQPDAGVEP
jgi:uncharacterized protein